MVRARVKSCPPAVRGMIGMRQLGRELYKHKVTGTSKNVTLFETRRRDPGAVFPKSTYLRTISELRLYSCTVAPIRCSSVLHPTFLLVVVSVVVMGLGVVGFS